MSGERELGPWSKRSRGPPPPQGRGNSRPDEEREREDERGPRRPRRPWAFPLLWEGEALALPVCERRRGEPWAASPGR